MKLTKEQENTLRELAFAELPNSEIAKRMELPLTGVHAARHRMGITIAKVAAAKGKQPQAAPLEPTVGAARQQMTVEPELEAAVVAAERGCKTCARWACFARGSNCIVPDCSHYVTEENRRREYAQYWKQDFLNAISCSDLSPLDTKTVNIIAVYLNAYIPESWGDGK